MNWIRVLLISIFIAGGFAIGWIACSFYLQSKEHKRMIDECDRMHHND